MRTHSRHSIRGTRTATEARADDLGVAWQLWEAGRSRSRRRRRRRIVFHDDRQNMVSMASRVELSPNGGIHRIIPVPTKRATGAILGRFTRFRPNFTQNSRSVEVVRHQRDFGAILVRRHCTPIFFCFNHRSHNAAHPTALRIRCASAAQPLPPFSRGYNHSSRGAPAGRAPHAQWKKERT